MSNPKPSEREERPREAVAVDEVLEAAETALDLEPIEPLHREVIRDLSSMVQDFRETLREVLNELEWRGGGEDRNCFYCPMCKASSLDCTKIKHDSSCQWLRWAAALARANPAAQDGEG